MSPIFGVWYNFEEIAPPEAFHQLLDYLGQQNLVYKLN